MLPFLLTALLAQPLDTSKVASTRAVVPLQHVPDEAALLPVLAEDALSVEARSDLEVLRVRFAAIARKEGLRGFSEEPVAAQLQPRTEGVVNIRREVKGETATWTFLANQLELTRKGAGCCPECPCVGHNCAPCVRCEEHGCEYVTTGTQVVVTFTVVGRKLRSERAVVQPVSSSMVVGAARRTLSIERVEPAGSPFARELRGRAQALTVCSRQAAEVTPGRATVEVEQDVSGAISEVRVVESSLGASFDACVSRALKSMRTTVRDEPGTARVVLRYE